MGQLFLMTNLFIKFQNCNLIFVTDAQTDGRKDGQTQRNMPFNFFKVGGIVESKLIIISFKINKKKNVQTH